jgi:hypothetical protein
MIEVEIAPGLAISEDTLLVVAERLEEDRLVHGPSLTLDTVRGSIGAAFHVGASSLDDAARIGLDRLGDAIVSMIGSEPPIEKLAIARLVD